MRLFIHALGASAGGGLTYLRNVVPHLLRRDVKITLLAGQAAIDDLPAGCDVELVLGPKERSAGPRFLWEQREIPKLVQKARADVLLCAGNFAVWKSPVPQILLSRNSLYTSAEFTRDLRERGDYRLLADNQIKGYVARKSILRAELTVAPSEAFAHDLETWSRKRVFALHHGFDSAQFFGTDAPLAADLREKLKQTEGATRVLFVSHYNYYRNFETLFRGLALLKARQPERRTKLVLTCELAPGKNPGSYRTETAAAMLRELQITEDVVQLGAIPYPSLHQLYRACQIYVSPAYTETFAHPLVEAMASGVPVVASDLPVHREITGGAALYFEKFSAADVANKIAQLQESPTLQAELREKGLRRAKEFNWSTHVDRLFELAQGVISNGASKLAGGPS